MRIISELFRGDIGIIWGVIGVFEGLYRDYIPGEALQVSLQHP